MMLKRSFKFNVLILAATISIIYSAQGAPLEDHRTEIAELGKKTQKFERRIADLQKRKTQAREGEELESVLDEIGEVHRELLALRRDRNALKQHLLADHPESNLIYDPSLYKNFDKKKANQRSPLDDRLDDLLNLMQTQYAKYLPKRVKEDPVLIPQEVAPQVEAPKVFEKAPSATAEVKEKYLQEQIQTEMKIGNPTEPGAKISKPAVKEAAKHDEKPSAPKTEPAHGEKPKSGHH